MNRFFALCLGLSMATVFFAGCNKKAEVKTETTTTTPEGTTTETHVDKVETDKK
jgi:hypothetical protein